MNRGVPIYAPLSVVGLELEYAVVDADLRPRCLVEAAFRAAHGRGTSDVERGAVGFSNELAAHVFETKMLRPEVDLVAAERQLVEGVRYFSGLLRDHFGARLMPTGMHPMMHPSETELWQRSGRAIYAAYARVFDIREHGWLNVQSCHVNLPFGHTDHDAVLLYNATACLLPYLPALAASSPLVEGRLGPCVDNRLAFYRNNQRRVPVITGDVVPEFIDSIADYRRMVLAPIYHALREVPGAELLRHEWVNSRGAIMRFQRRALEIRVIDVQECVVMDAAIAAFVRGVMRWLVRELGSKRMSLPEHGMLVADFERVVADGRAAHVEAVHLSRGLPAKSGWRAGDVLSVLLEHARPEVEEVERAYLDLVAERICGGSLSECLRTRLGRNGSGERIAVGRIREVYEELIDCLERNRPWRP